MPQTEVYFYQNEDGSSPIVEWLKDLRRKNVKAYTNCLAKVRLLRMFGHELRRPAADYLRDGIYELRAKDRNVQHRLLYFYHGRNIAIVAHGLTKEKKVPAADIDRALERKKRYEQNPAKHRAEEELL